MMAALASVRPSKAPSSRASFPRRSVQKEAEARRPVPWKHQEKRHSEGQGRGLTRWRIVLLGSASSGASSLVGLLRAAVGAHNSWPFPARGVSSAHLSEASLYSSPEAVGKQPHAKGADGVPVSAQQPDSPAQGKVFPEVEQVGGLVLGADGM